MANDELEERVFERTKELKAINELLRQEYVERERLEREILMISEREQKRIGQDLHDSLGQTLTAISYKVKLLEKKLMDKVMPEPEEASNIVKLVGDSISQARNIAKGLYPDELTQIGLDAALEELRLDVTNKYGIECILQYNMPTPFVSEIAIQLYRIIQEAVSNAIKHASSKKIVMTVKGIGVGILISIQDNGIGLPQDEKKGKGIGLQIMKYRASLIGGKLHVENHPNGGTLVTCIIERVKKDDQNG